jgi:hypothetical protein
MNQPAHMIDPTGMDPVGDISIGNNSVQNTNGSYDGEPAPINQPMVDSNTVLPDGQTLGAIIIQYRSQLQDMMNLALQNPMCDDPVGEATATMYLIAKTNGPIDFKNNFRGEADGTMLGLAGNFAYYAIGSGILPDSVLDAGAGLYALKSVWNGQKQFSSLTGRMYSDASAASVRDAALSWGASQ